MKLTCPTCSAQYTLSEERLHGRRVKVRCRKCGESFAVDASQQSGEVYARQSETRRGRDADLFAGAATAGAEPLEEASSTTTPLIGERNESSVLFSLAALSKQAPVLPRANVTESSALIDIRALVSATPRDVASAQPADDIMNLSGGGAFAQLFSAPAAPPVTFAPAENETARRRKGAITVGAIAIAFVGLVGAAALVVVQSRSSAPRVTAPAATALSSPVETATSEAPPPAPSTLVSSPAVSDPTPARTATIATVAPPARSSVHPTVATPAPTVSTASTASTAPKCCAGESEMACQMRRSAGAACSTEPTRSTATPTPPFDRPAAARALGISMAGCKRGDGPTGAGHAKVTFQPSGSVSAVEIDAPYAGTATGACVAQRFRGASVPAFAGGPLGVGKTFAIE